MFSSLIPSRRASSRLVTQEHLPGGLADGQARPARGGEVGSSPHASERREQGAGAGAGGEGPGVFARGAGTVTRSNDVGILRVVQVRSKQWPEATRQRARLFFFVWGGRGRSIGAFNVKKEMELRAYALRPGATAGVGWVVTSVFRSSWALVGPPVFVLVRPGVDGVTIYKHYRARHLPRGSHATRLW